MTKPEILRGCCGTRVGQPHTTLCDVGRIQTLIQERNEAREAAQEYYQDIRQLEGDYQWEKHYAHDPEQPDRTWLKPVKKLGPP